MMAPVKPTSATPTRIEAKMIPSANVRPTRPQDVSLSRRQLCTAAAGTASALALSNLARPLCAQADEAAADDATTPSQWLDSNVDGNVSQDTPAQTRDDFYLSIDKDWLLETQVPEGETSITSFSELSAEVRDKACALLSGPACEDHSSRQAQLFYQRHLDMDARNAAGVEPLLPYLAQVEAIGSLDDAAQVCCDPHGIASFIGWEVSPDLYDSAHYALYVSSPTMLTGDADEMTSPSDYGTRKTQAARTLVATLLGLCGYDETDAQATVEAGFALDAELNAACLGTSAMAAIADYAALYPAVTRDELCALAPNFPLGNWLDSMIGNAQGTIICDAKDYLVKLGEVFVPERLDDIRAWLVCQVTFRFTPLYEKELGGGLFNQAWIDAVDAAMTSVNSAPYTSVPDKDAYTLTSHLLDMAVGRQYCDNYCPQETRDRISELIDEIVAVFRGRLTATTWLGEGTREKAIEKLDCLQKNVACPDDWAPFELDGLDLESDEASESLLASYLATVMWTSDRERARFGQTVGPEAGWSLPPQAVNAFYNPQNNSINILAGVLGGVFYEEDMGRAELLGGIGMIIGHEITHAFDKNGSQFDAQGSIADWWDDQDKAAFDERVKALEDYFSSFEALPGQYVNGALVSGEATADLGSVSCMLELGRGEDGFDYQAFFEHYAMSWRTKYPLGSLQSRLATDPHPPAYLRTNAIVQQFQEFYDTYGVAEGDGMYLAPEKRLSIW